MEAEEFLKEQKIIKFYMDETSTQHIAEVMESYAQEKVREKIDQHRALTRDAVEADQRRIEELEHKLELERGISDGKNAIIESQQRREMELESKLKDAIDLLKQEGMYSDVQRLNLQG